MIPKRIGKQAFRSDFGTQKRTFLLFLFSTEQEWSGTGGGDWVGHFFTTKGVSKALSNSNHHRRLQLWGRLLEGEGNRFGVYSFLLGFFFLFFLRIVSRILSFGMPM